MFTKKQLADIYQNKQHHIENVIREILGSYNKKNPNVDMFLEKIDFALEQAKILNNTPNGHWPQELGTHVYKFINSLKKVE